MGAKFDGRDLPMYLALCGKVVDVTSSDNFNPDAGYGKLWAGRETTYAMAKVSLKPEDTGRLDFKLEELNEEEHRALAVWYKHFITKYPVVGTLKEYDGWDWSVVEKSAGFDGPCGAGNEDGDARNTSAVTSAPKLQTLQQTSHKDPSNLVKPTDGTNVV